VLLVKVPASRSMATLCSCESGSFTSFGAFEDGSITKSPSGTKKSSRPGSVATMQTVKARKRQKRLPCSDRGRSMSLYLFVVG